MKNKIIFFVLIMKLISVGNVLKIIIEMITVVLLICLIFQSYLLFLSKIKLKTTLLLELGIKIQRL
jgi:hypothetical protein